MRHSSEQTTQYRDGRATCARQTNGFLGRLTLAWLLGRRVASGIALTCFLSLVGCTTQLQVMSDEADIGKLKDPKGGPLEGVIYYLPSVEFDITATWRLVSCNDDKADARLSFELAERYVADHSRPFVIDYKMLEAWLKHTDLEVLLYPNGTLRSINGDVQDKAGTVVPSLLELTSSAVDTAHTLEGRSGQSHCNPVAEQAMKQRVDLSKQIIKLKAKIAEISSRDPLDNCDKKELRQAKENLGIKRSALAEYSKQSSHKQSISWMPSHGTDKTTIKMVPRGRRKLFGEGNYTAPNLCITATLQPYDLPKGIVRSDTNPGKHLIYRAPAAAILEFRFCGYNPEIVAREHVKLPQAGVHLALPLVNAAFDKTNLVAEFDENGALSRFQFVTGARLESLAQALATTAKTANEIFEARKGRELKKVQAKTELLKAKAEFIKAERDLQALEDVKRAQPSP